MGGGTYQCIYTGHMEFEKPVGHPSEEDEQGSGQMNWELTKVVGRKPRVVSWTPTEETTLKKESF